MKKLIALFAAIVLVSGFTSTVKAQANATANAVGSATIITPLTISKTIDMNFGNVAVSSTVAGTVVLTSAGSRTVTGGVTLPAVAGTVTAASFTVNGLGTSAFTVTLPSTDFILTDGSSHNMTVNAFTSTPTGSTALVGGTKTITVGATLNVSAGQAANVYTNAGGFPVTVNYN
jgi:hypothetical protein